MTTRYYYSGNEPLRCGVQAQLDADESRHLIKVMRARPGQELVVFGRGGQFEAEFVEKAGGGCAVIMPTVQLEAIPPPSLAITFLIPWIKGGKTEMVVQKLTELGVHGVIVFQAVREVARGDNDKRERLQRVAIEACKQCERSDVPSIALAPGIAEAVKLCDGIPPEARFILHERLAGRPLSQAAQPLMASQTAMMLASGPEGGWDPGEIAGLGEGATLVSLGPRILRAETAPIAAMAALLTLSGDM